MKYLAKNEQETIKIGKKIAAGLKSGDILCLYGDLGAGKTTLVKGLAEGLGVKHKITSPTFAILNLYQIQKMSKLKTQNSPPKADQPWAEKPQLKSKKLITYLAHFDLYRLKGAEEFSEIGGEEYLGDKNTICVIEWPEKIETLLKKKKCVKIHIKHHKNGREINYKN